MAAASRQHGHGLEGLVDARAGAAGRAGHHLVGGPFNIRHPRPGLGPGLVMGPGTSPQRPGPGARNPLLVDHVWNPQSRPVANKTPSSPSDRQCDDRLVHPSRAPPRGYKGQGEQGTRARAPSATPARPHDRGRLVSGGVRDGSRISVEELIVWPVSAPTTDDGRRRGREDVRVAFSWGTH